MKKEQIVTAVVLVLVAVCAGIFVTVTISKKEKARQDELVEKYFGKSEQSQLLEAALAGDKEEFKKSLARGGDVNFKGLKGTTPLGFAVLRLNKEGVMLLLENGANPNQMQDDGNGAVHLSIIFSKDGDPWFLDAILKHGGDPNLAGNPGDEPIFDAITVRSLPMVKLLKDAGAKLDARNSSFGSPLAYAASTGQFDTVQYLLDQGVNPKSTDASGHDIVDIIKSRHDDPSVPFYKDREKVIDWLKQKKTWRD